MFRKLELIAHLKAKTQNKGLQISSDTCDTIFCPLTTKNKLQCQLLNSDMASMRVTFFLGKGPIPYKDSQKSKLKNLFRVETNLSPQNKGWSGTLLYGFYSRTPSKDENKSTTERFPISLPKQMLQK